MNSDFAEKKCRLPLQSIVEPFLEENLDISPEKRAQIRTASYSATSTKQFWDTVEKILADNPDAMSTKTQ